MIHRRQISNRQYRFAWILVTLVGAACLAFAPAAAAEWVRADEAIMGTAIQVELWHEDRDVGARAASAVMDEMRRIDALMSTYKSTSELSRINATAAKGAVAVGPELAVLFRRAAAISEMTGGAFDITYASVGQYYDYRAGERPDEATLARALQAVDFRNVELDEAAGTVSFRHPGVRVDLGGIAKGYAVERGVDILRGFGVTSAIVTAGGDSRILGDRRGKPWVVGVRDPRRDGAIVARLPLSDEAISTSGDYERYFETDGVRYHHILKPGTGRSSGEVRSVTILGPDATTTDALSTSVFVMGIQKGMAMIEKLAANEAVIVDADGRLHYTSGFSRPES